MVPVDDASGEPPRTQVREERTGRLITTNRSPDIPFERWLQDHYPDRAQRVMAES